MKIRHLHMIEGAKEAEGLTVIIDVFRAFSLECYLHDMNVKAIRPVGSIEEAFRLSEIIPDSVLVGERGGKSAKALIMEIHRPVQTVTTWREKPLSIPPAPVPRELSMRNMLMRSSPEVW